MAWVEQSLTIQSMYNFHGKTKNPWPLEGSFEYVFERIYMNCKSSAYISKYSGRSLIVMGLISPKIRNPDLLSI